jgi:hypothetical protein
MSVKCPGPVSKRRPGRSPVDGSESAARRELQLFLSKNPSLGPYMSGRTPPGRPEGVAPGPPGWSRAGN